jgi:ABC-type nitrate/sulfonate/bicarbonate transport system permease component
MPHAAAGSRGNDVVAEIALRAFAPLLLIAVWLGAASYSQIVASVLPPPQAVVAALLREAIDGSLGTHILHSLFRAACGFALAAAVGTTLGFLMSRSALLRHVLNGPIELLRPVSSIAWIPLAILWFGIGVKSVVFVIFISCVFIVLLSTVAAALDVDVDLLKAARTLGADRAAVFFKVIVPNALPGVLLGLRIALTGAWGGVLVAEMIASQTGLGFMIARAQATFQPALVIGGMVVIGLMGYFLNRAFMAAEKRLTHAHA